MDMLRFPRMLFKGEATCVVADETAQAQKLAEGWDTRPLPGEVPPDEPIEPKKGKKKE